MPETINPYTAPGETGGAASATAHGYSIEQIQQAFKLYTGLYWGGLIGVVVAGVVAGIMVAGTAATRRGEDPDVAAAGVLGVAGLVLLAAVGVLVAGMIVGLVALYRGWRVIQPHARTTPGKAVGFQFIPFFNFYWIFVAYRGLMDDLAQYAARHGLGIRPPVGLATTYCVVFLVSILPIPFVGNVAQLASLVLGYLVMRAVRDGTIAVIQHQAGA